MTWIYVPNRPRGFADAEPQNKGDENMENPEIKSLITLIQRLEAVRAEYTITYEGLAEVVEMMKQYAWETEKHDPLKEEAEKS